MVDVDQRWPDPARPGLPDDLCLMLYPTLRCNVRCTFCYQDSFATSLEPEILNDRLASVYKSARDVQLVGGEITTLSWGKDFMRRLADESPTLKLHLITNGIALDQDWQNLILDLSVNVVVSLNAPTPDDYRAVVTSQRAPDLWRAAFTNLSSLLARARNRPDVRIDISMVVTDATEPFMERFVVLARQLGTGCRLAFDCRTGTTTVRNQALVERVRALRAWLAPLHLRVVGLGPIAPATAPGVVDEADRRRWNEWAAQPAACAVPAMAAAGPPAPPTPDGRGPRRLHSTEGQYANFGAAVGTVRGRTGCLAPWRSLVVTAWGGVLACPNLAGRPLGNIRQQSVEEIWNSTEAVALRTRLLSGDYSGCPATCETNQDVATAACLPERSVDAA